MSKTKNELIQIFKTELSLTGRFGALKLLQ